MENDEESFTSLEPVTNTKNILQTTEYKKTYKTTLEKFAQDAQMCRDRGKSDPKKADLEIAALWATAVCLLIECANELQDSPNLGLAQIQDFRQAPYKEKDLIGKKYGLTLSDFARAAFPIDESDL